MSDADQASTSLARWELENMVQSVPNEDIDVLYKWNPEEQREMQRTKPWQVDVNYFQKVRISALALLKMAIHARSGGELEVMGVMQGKVLGDTFVVTDAFPLPVEGTETRVNAQSEAYEYMVDFLETSKAAGREENIVGWYHSHPGYGCWLSGIDVGTQLTNQRYQEPFLAVVVDPKRTEAAGKVELGAFRTYPEGHKPSGATPAEYQTIPMEKIEDFGVHANEYYPLQVSYFKSSLDAHLLGLLWSSYWMKTLCATPLFQNRTLTTSHISDLASKLKSVAAGAQKEGLHRLGSKTDRGGKTALKLEHLAQDSTRLVAEMVKGLTNQATKSMLTRGLGDGALQVQAMEQG